MSNPNQFAVVQKEAVSPTVDQLKSAFKSFSNLTAADAVRLAHSSRGILMRCLGADAARAVQVALQAEGIGSVVVPETQLPQLPDGRSLHRLEMSPDAFVAFDVLGRPTPIPWRNIRLIAAGAVQHFGMTKTTTERSETRFSLVSGVRTRQVTDTSHKVESESRLSLEVFSCALDRFQVDATQFPFKYLIDQPGLTTADKFVWLVRQLCSRAPGAILNPGARAIVEEHPTLMPYANRQALVDEIVWLLWRAAQP